MTRWCIKCLITSNRLRSSQLMVIRSVLKTQKNGPVIANPRCWFGTTFHGGIGVKQTPGCRLPLSLFSRCGRGSVSFKLDISWDQR